MENENPLQKTFVVELALLKALAIREHYDNYFGYVNYDRLQEETRVFLDSYKYYFDLYKEHKEIDFDTFLTQFTTNWYDRDMNQVQIELYSQAILKVRDTPIVDAESSILGLIDKQFLDNINFIGKKPLDIEVLRKELDLYENKRAGIIRDYDADVLTCDKVDFTKIDKSLGIPYFFDLLTESLGGMVDGSLVFLVGASGLGKTLLSIRQEVVTLKWLHKNNIHKPVMVLTTEGTREERFGRMWSNMYQKQFPGGYREIMKNRERISKHYEKTFGKNSYLVYIGNDRGLNYIRMKIKKYKPALVVLDMGQAVMTAIGKSSGETQDNKAFFNGLRRISSENCPIIVTIQAGVGAKYWDKDAHKYKYKQWLTDDDIYGSKSAVQGAAETIISMGRDNEHEFDRFIETTKLKSDADPVKLKAEIVRRFSDISFVSDMGIYRYER